MNNDSLLQQGGITYSFIPQVGMKAFHFERELRVNLVDVGPSQSVRWHRMKAAIYCASRADFEALVAIFNTQSPIRRYRALL